MLKLNYVAIFVKNKRFHRVALFTILSAFALLAILGCAPEADRPNIIIIMVDDMGFAGPSITPYGNPHYQTPGMDRLAREGLRFTDFHSSGPVCSPTRAGLVTGRYQQRVGVEALIHPLPGHPEHLKGLHENEVTFAELFKAAVLWPKRQVKEGYLSTTLFNKNGNMVSGYVHTEDEHRVVIRDAVTGELQTVPANLVQMREDAGTLMPPGLTAGLNYSELRDLIRYLSELKGRGTSD